MQYLGVIKSFAARRSVVGAIVFAMFASFSVMSAAAQINDRMGETTFASGSVGMIPGQSAHIGIVNVAFGDGSVRMIGGHVKVFDLNGVAVATIPVPRIRSGESHVVQIKREDLSHVGDPNTGRLQVRFEVWLQHSVMPANSGGTSRPFQPSFELVNDETGQSVLIGLLLPAIQN